MAHAATGFGADDCVSGESERSDRTGNTIRRELRPVAAVSRCTSLPLCAICHKRREPVTDSVVRFCNNIRAPL